MINSFKGCQVLEANYVSYQEQDTIQETLSDIIFKFKISEKLQRNYFVRNLFVIGVAIIKGLKCFKKGEIDAFYSPTTDPIELWPTYILHLLKGVEFFVFSHNQMEIQVEHPYVFFRKHEHYGVIHSLFWSIAEFLSHFILKRALGIFTPSDVGRRYLEKIGIKGEATFRTSSFIDDETIFVNNLKKKYDFVVLARIIPRKNLNTIIEALSLSNLLCGKERKMAIITPTSGKALLDIKGLIHSKGLSDIIDIIHNASEDSKIAVLDQSKIYISLSLDESFPTSNLEASARGLAMLLSDIPAHTSIYKDAAIFVNPCDVAKIAEQMIYLTDNDDLAKKLSELSFKVSKLYLRSVVLAGEIRWMKERYETRNVGQGDFC